MLPNPAAAVNRERAFASLYQSSLSANCTWRAVVDVLVIAPAVPETPLGLLAVGGVKTIRLGVLKLARFRRLKISRELVVFADKHVSDREMPGQPPSSQ